MPRHKILSIKERGGLKPYLESEGLDYDLFKQLRALYPDRWSVIAEGMSKELIATNKKPISSWRVKNWCHEDDEEMEALKNASN